MYQLLGHMLFSLGENRLTRDSRIRVASEKIAVSARILLIRTPFLRCECRRVLTCMSSKTGSYDIVGVFYEVKMKNSANEGEGYGQDNGLRVFHNDILKARLQPV